MMDSQKVSRRHFVHGIVSATGGALAAATLTSKGAAANEISHSTTDTHGGSRPVEADESTQEMTSLETQHDPFRGHLRRGLGGPWPEPSPLEPVVGEPIVRDGYRIEPVSFLAEPDDRVPALLLVPDGATAAAPAAAICVWHQHAGQYHLGKSEPAGLEGDPQHHTGAALARLGYVVLSIDAIGFEERRPSARSDKEDPGKINPEEGGREDQPTLKGGAYERFLFLKYVVRGKSLAWKNILDMRRAVDYLATRPEVDSERIGCYGHSMGSTHTWLVGPWEPRLKALVGNCCLPTYRGIEREGLLHCFPNFIPGIYPEYDTPDVAALIAPRPLHLNFGELDRGSPIDEARRGAEVIARAYQQQGASENFSCYMEPGAGHVLSERMWERVQDFFARHLG